MVRMIGFALFFFASTAWCDAPPAWPIDYAKSRIGFVAEQAGAKFPGRFEHFEADVHFDPKTLAESYAVVRVATASVMTEDGERDSILRGEGWFESDKHADARFEARGFEATANGYRAKGTLTVGDKSTPVQFDFHVTDAGLVGGCDLDRLSLGLGLGDWADEKMIGRQVHVDVVVVKSR
jgi:polyisoprenoid-binding protein YceI